MSTSYKAVQFECFHIRQNTSYKLKIGKRAPDKCEMILWFNGDVMKFPDFLYWVFRFALLTSWHGHAFHISGLLWGESISYWWLQKQFYVNVCLSQRKNMFEYLPLAKNCSFLCVCQTKCYLWIVRGLEKGTKQKWNTDTGRVMVKFHYFFTLNILLCHDDKETFCITGTLPWWCYNMKMLLLALNEGNPSVIIRVILFECLSVALTRAVIKTCLFACHKSSSVWMSQNQFYLHVCLWKSCSMKLVHLYMCFIWNNTN